MRRWKRNPYVVPFAGLVLGLTGCANLFESDCVSVGVIGISATVISASTRQAPLSIPTMRITDGAYEETATLFPRSDPPKLLGASERVGTYRVVVQATGYQDYIAESIQVTRGGHCNSLMGVQITVPLQPIT